MAEGDPGASPMAAVEDGPRICDPGGGGQWLPIGAQWENEMNPRLRMILYFAGMIYSFLGVSIVADTFCAAIDRLTSVQSCARVGNSKRFKTSPVWNDTVANLTLMALGSSAPEIMLSLNDILKRNFVQGKLGASTIVGSASFNLFVIIAVCINAIPDGEVRVIKETGVYAITAVGCIFAYVWLLFIVAINGPGRIDVIEGTMTFLWFPILVVLSYYADIGVLTTTNLKAIFRRKMEASFEDEPKTWLEKFKVDNHREEDIDEEERARRAAEKAAKEAAMAARQKERGLSGEGQTQEKKPLCSRLRKCCSCSCRNCFRICMRRKARSAKSEEDKKDDEEKGRLTVEDGEELDGEEEEVNSYLADPAIPLLDDDGEPLDNEHGILTFTTFSMVIRASEEESKHKIKVVRKNGNEGKVSCKYRMEQLSAIPGFDYEDDEGTLVFRDGVNTAEVEVTILAKKPGERSDRFQIVLEDAEGGATFNPDYDGEEECQRLTIMVANKMRAGRGITTFLDRLLNLDEMRQGTALWKEQVWEALYVGGSKEEQDQAGFIEWMWHLIWLPWTLLFNLFTPPPAYLGGWVCFVVSLGHIAWLTIIIGDMAELFGCVADLDDQITAISFVAMGTSVPDLFASMTAAKQDEYADASIVNVTGSNSVNVFLGIGLPWMLAAFYWRIKDGSEFEVTPGDLGFSVIVFTIMALAALFVIGYRRRHYGGELGGEAAPKAYSSFLFIIFWFTYIFLSSWKILTPDADTVLQATMIAVTVPMICIVMLIFGAIRVALIISKDYIGEEGFWGIFVAVSFVGLRLLILFMFQSG